MKKFWSPLPYTYTYICWSRPYPEETKKSLTAIWMSTNVSKICYHVSFRAISTLCFSRDESVVVAKMGFLESWVLHGQLFFGFWVDTMFKKKYLAYRPVAKLWLCKQRPFLGNSSVNTFPLLGTGFLIMQQLDYNNGPCWDIISKGA
jgi:hypothetical protein